MEGLGCGLQAVAAARGHQQGQASRSIGSVGDVGHPVPGDGRRVEFSVPRAVHRRRGGAMAVTLRDWYSMLPLQNSFTSRDAYAQNGREYCCIGAVVFAFRYGAKQEHSFHQQSEIL